jgi:hypothetical protein
MGQRFSDISFVSAGYAPRAKGAAFAGCAGVRLPLQPGPVTIPLPDCVTPGLNLRALRQISGHKLLIPLPGAG